MIRDRTEINQPGELQDEDSIQAMEEQIAELCAELALMHDEEPRLRELLDAAERVTDETKIARILDIVHEVSGGGSVLFFTEYKATQSLLMSALMREFGDESVTFINGDARAEDVADSSGRKRPLLFPGSGRRNVFAVVKCVFSFRPRPGARASICRSSAPCLCTWTFPGIRCGFINVWVGLIDTAR